MKKRPKTHLSQMNYLTHYPHKTIEIQNLFGKNTPNILYSFGNVWISELGLIQGKNQVVKFLKVLAIFCINVRPSPRAFVSRLWFSWYSDILSRSYCAAFICLRRSIASVQAGSILRTWYQFSIAV